MEYKNIKLDWKKVEEFFKKDIPEEYRQFVKESVNMFLNYESTFGDNLSKTKSKKEINKFYKTKWFDILDSCEFVKINK
jgi:hypothetical protein